MLKFKKLKKNSITKYTFDFFAAFFFRTMGE